MLLLDAEAALRAAPRVAQIVAAELDRDKDWTAGELRRFEELARGYTVTGAAPAARHRDDAG